MRRVGLFSRGDLWTAACLGLVLFQQSTAVWLRCWTTEEACLHLVPTSPNPTMSWFCSMVVWREALTLAFHLGAGSFSLRLLTRCRKKLNFRGWKEKHATETTKHESSRADSPASTLPAPGARSTQASSVHWLSPSVDSSRNACMVLSSCYTPLSRFEVASQYSWAPGLCLQNEAPFGEITWTLRASHRQPAILFLSFPVLGILPF